MKIRTGFISNSSSCSFVICKKIISEEQANKILDWYAEKLKNNIYMDDMGNFISNNKNYIWAHVSYVVDELVNLLSDMGIPAEDYLLL